MKFTEETLEQAVTELLQAGTIERRSRLNIHKEKSEVLLRNDLRSFLLNQYTEDKITMMKFKALFAN